jgi:hypothetical protein
MSPVMSIRRARVFWIESEPLSGGSASQVEFPVEIGPFFGGSSRPSIGDELWIRLISAGVEYPSKKMDFHHNDVWRLNLPTGRQGLGPYRRTILCFEKTLNPDLFRLTVVQLNSPLERALKRTTRRGGRIGNTLRASGHPRGYGYF